MFSPVLFLSSLLFLSHQQQVMAFSPVSPSQTRTTTATTTTTTTKLSVVDPAAASMVAGSIAGAIGVGVAHPLDTLNIKTQVRQAAVAFDKLNAADTTAPQKSAGVASAAPLQVVKPAAREAQEWVTRSPSSSSTATPIAQHNDRSSLTTLQATATMSPPPPVAGLNRRRWGDFIPNNGNSWRLPVPTVTATVAGSTPVAQKSATTVATPAESVDSWQIMKEVYETQGFAGFLGGIRIMMLGQGMVKAVAFTVNAAALTFLTAYFHESAPSTTTFIMAAAIAGFSASFIVNPVERVKVLLQAADNNGDEDAGVDSEWECIKRVLDSEGWFGFLGRGLGTTMLREVPSDAIYFSVYGLLMQQQTLFEPWLASIIFGATAGCACWIPVYPVDLVKTLVQNTEGAAAADAGDGNAAQPRDTWQVVQDVYATGGVGAFFEGITPKLLRAALFHAITFWIYDTLFPILQDTANTIGSSTSAQILANSVFSSHILI